MKTKGELREDWKKDNETRARNKDGRIMDRDRENGNRIYRGCVAQNRQRMGTR